MLKFGLETGTLYGHAFDIRDIHEEYVTVTGVEAQDRDYLMKLMANYQKTHAIITEGEKEDV